MCLGEGRSCFCPLLLRVWCGGGLPPTCSRLWATLSGLAATKIEAAVALTDCGGAEQGVWACWGCLRTWIKGRLVAARTVISTTPPLTFPHICPNSVLSDPAATLEGLAMSQCIYLKNMPPSSFSLSCPYIQSHSPAQQHIGWWPLRNSIVSFLCALFQPNVCCCTLPLTMLLPHLGPPG